MEKLIGKVIYGMKRFSRDFVRPISLSNKTKYFCIGRNKTGTTSLKRAFMDLGFIVGDQRTAERLLPYYTAKNYKPIFRYCRSAQVFQDIPFSLPNTYKHLSSKFPNSKFILTVRDSPEQWYQSITKFHSKLFGDGNVPTEEHLKNAEYVYKGFMWEAQKAICNSPNRGMYNKEALLESYREYNSGVLKFFENREEDLLVINLSDGSSYQKLVDFLNVSSEYEGFLWENKTSEIKNKP